MSDPWADPVNQEWIQHVRTELVPKLRGSAATVSLFTSTEPDVKFAVELGMSILLDEPIIAIVAPGVVVPEHLVRVADKIIEGDVSDPSVADRLRSAVDEVTGENVYGGDD